jgi:hypothetical protein
MLMGWDYVPELQPPTGLLFFRLVIYERREPRWKNIDMEKPKYSDTNLFQGQWIHLKFHMDWPGRESGPLQWEADDSLPEPWHGLDASYF